MTHSPVRSYLMIILHRLITLTVNGVKQQHIEEYHLPLK